MRRTLALALLAATAFAATTPALADANAPKIVQCFNQYNNIPEPGYGGWVIQPEETVACWLA